jgi:RND family efflux transporter MFP subunit
MALHAPHLAPTPVVLLCAFLLSCSDPPPATDPPPPPVSIEVVEAVARSPSIEVTGTVQAERRATLRAETAGRVIAAPFRAGATVAADQVVLRLDVSRSQISVEQARARLAQAEAALRQATRAREDAEALSAEGAHTRTLLEQARDREAEATARLEEAQAGVRAARADVSEAVLTAPFDGVLADFRVREGDFVAPGTEVAVLVDRTRLEAELLLDPEEGAGVSEGGEVTVRATRDRVFSGTAVFVGEILDPRTRRLPVRVQITDPDGALLPGEVATFHVAVGPPRDAIVLPESAIVRRHGRTLVFVVKDDRAEARTVRVAPIRASEAEILDGELSPGETVIVRGIERIEDGGAVRVVDDSPDPGDDTGAAGGT